MNRTADSPLGSPRRDRRRARWVLALMLALVGLNLAWRTARWALGFPLWGDEAFIVISLQSRDFAGLIRPLEYGQVAPLGFMWAERAAAEVLGYSERALRLLPYLCGVATLLLFWRFARRVLDVRSALLAVGILAASYYPVRHGAEVKPYAQDLFVAICILSLAWAVHNRGRSLWRWAALTVAAGAGVWLSYPAVFIAGGAGMLLFYEALRERSARRWACTAVYGLALAGSFAAMYFFYGRPHGQAARYMTEIVTWAPYWPPTAKPWLLPWWALKIHAGRMMSYPVGGKNFGSVGTLILVVVGVAALWRGRRRPLLALLLAPLPLMFLAAAFEKYPYGGSQRIAQHVAPAFCLLAGVGLAAILRHAARRLGRQATPAIVIAAFVLAGIAVGGIVRDLAAPYKKDSDRLNRQYIAEMAAQTRPGDRWVVFNAIGESPFAPNLLGWGGSGARLRYYVSRFVPAEVRWSLAPRDVPVPVGEGRVWLVAYHDNNSAFPQEQFDAYLAAVKARLGSPRHKTYVLASSKDPQKDRREALDVYVFAPADASAVEARTD